MMPRSRFKALSPGCSFLLLSSALASRAGAAELEVIAPADCEKEADLKFQIERGLGQSLSEARDTHYALEIRRHRRAWAGTLRADTVPPSERTITADSCVDLIDAMAVAIVFSLASGEASGGATPPEEAAAPGVARASEPDALVAIEPDEPAPELAHVESIPLAWETALLVAVLGDIGALPDAALGLRLGAELRRGHWAVAVSGSLLFPQVVTLSRAEPPPSADLELSFGALTGCHVRQLPSAVLSLAPCIGWELGWLRGEGDNLRVSRSVGRLWTGPALALQASADLGEMLSFRLELGAFAPLTRHEFTLDGQRVYVSPSIIGRLALGLGWVID